MYSIHSTQTITNRKGTIRCTDLEKVLAVSDSKFKNQNTDDNKSESLKLRHRLKNSGVKYHK